MLKFLYLLMLVSLLLFQNLGFAQFWEYQVAGTSQNLNSVYMHDTQSGWICGNAGTLLKTTNAGQNWNQVNVTSNNLNSILFATSTIGIAVGANGTIIRTTDGGTSWNTITSTTTQTLRKISKGSGLLVAVGDNGTVLISLDNGLNWTSKTSGTTTSLKSAGVFGTSQIWIGGDNGLIRYSSDIGDNWVTQTSGFSNNAVNDIQFVNNIGFAAGNGANFIYTTDQGQTWVPNNSGVWSDLYGVYFLDANIGWGVSIVGTIYFTTDGGNSWTSQPCGSAFTLREAYFLHQGKGWTVGDNGTIAMFTDNTVPVELNSFSAVVDGNNVNLTWSTATETNNRGFEIERKNINSDYQVVGFINGQGTTTELHSYSFSDKNLIEGKYNYRIKQIDFEGSFEYYELSSEIIITSPNNFSLEQNYPNPFNPSTNIRFTLPVAGNVSLKVFDALGNEVSALVNENKEAGSYNVEFRINNERISSGIYFYKLETEGFVETKKMLLLK